MLGQVDVLRGVRDETLRDDEIQLRRGMPTTTAERTAFVADGFATQLGGGLVV